MPNYAAAFCVAVSMMLAAWLLMKRANRKLARTRLKEFPSFRHGGYEVQLGLLSGVVAIIALAIGFSYL